MWACSPAVAPHRWMLLEVMPSARSRAVALGKARLVPFLAHAVHPRAGPILCQHCPRSRQGPRPAAKGRCELRRLPSSSSSNGCGKAAMRQPSRCLTIRMRLSPRWPLRIQTLSSCSKPVDPSPCRGQKASKGSSNLVSRNRRCTGDRQHPLRPRQSRPASCPSPSRRPTPNCPIPRSPA